MADVERLAEFLLATDPKAAVETGRILMEAIAMLTGHPLVGRIVYAYDKHQENSR